MNTIHWIISAFICCLLLSGTVDAARYIDSRDVKKSDFYTGEAAGGSLSYVPANTWLEQHSDSADEIAIRYKGFVVHDKALEEYVIAISNKLLRNWPGSIPDIHFYIVAQGSPVLYSAGTSAAGEIFISNGVLSQATSEDEIAAIIAHEIAHVLLGHNKKVSYIKTANMMADQAASYYALYKTIDEMSYNQDEGKIEADTSYEQEMLNTAKQKVIAKKLYASSHSTLFSRGAEYDADKLGLDLMMAGGYSPQGLKVSLERLAHSYSLTSELSQQLQDLSTQMLQEQSASLAARLRQGADKDELEDSMKAIAKDWQDKAEKKGLSTLMNFFSKSHPVPEKRVNRITEYIYSNYSRKERRRPLNQMGVEFLRSGRTGQLLENLQAANNGMLLISQGQYDEAVPLVMKAISAPSSDAAYNRFVAYRLRESQGNKASALKNLSLFDLQSWVPVEESALMADTYLNARQPRKAEVLIQNNERYFGTIDTYYPLKIRIARQDNNDPMVKQLAQECLDKASHEYELAQRCATLAGIPLEARAQPTSLLSGLKNLSSKLAKPE